MNKELITEWIEALRSGNYKQGFGQLKNNKDEYCCLGVACELFKAKIGGSWNPSFDGTKFSCTTGMTPLVGISHMQQLDLVDMNDLSRLSFDKIADYIEKEYLNA